MSELAQAVPLAPEAIRTWLARSPFVAFLGLELMALDPKEQTLSLRLPMRPELERSPGSGRCHGGVISALIDTAGDFVLIMLTGAAPPTLNFRVDYLRPATSPALTAIARVRQLGRSIAFVDVDVVDDADRVVAVGRANYAMATNVPGKAA